MASKNAGLVLGAAERAEVSAPVELTLFPETFGLHLYCNSSMAQEGSLSSKSRNGITSQLDRCLSSTLFSLQTELGFYARHGSASLRQHSAAVPKKSWGLRGGL